MPGFVPWKQCQVAVKRPPGTNNAGCFKKAFLFHPPAECCIREPKQEESNMLTLLCGRDPAELGIKTCEGWNITAFLDHLALCEECSQSQASLIQELNKLIGGRE